MNTFSQRHYLHCSLPTRPVIARVPAGRLPGDPADGVDGVGPLRVKADLVQGDLLGSLHSDKDMVLYSS